MFASHLTMRLFRSARSNVSIVTGAPETIIKTKEPWPPFDFGSVLHHRNLLYFFIKREIKVNHSQTLFGHWWLVLQPLIVSTVLSIVFFYAMHGPTDGIPGPLFYFVGVLLWNFFSQCLLGTATCFQQNADLLRKMYFPRLILPLSIAGWRLYVLSFSFLPFLILYVGFFLFSSYELRPQPTLFFLPFVILHLGVLAFAIGIFVASITLKYRDLHHLVGFFLQLWMFLSPVLYPLSAIRAPINHWLTLNPVSPIIGLSRHLVLGTPAGHLTDYLISLGITLSLISLSLLFFKQREADLIDFL